MSRTHPERALEKAEVEVEVPEAALEDAVGLYENKYGNPDPMEKNVTECVRKVVTPRFVTEDGRPVGDELVERCSWEPWSIQCPDCGNEWSGKAAAVPDRVDGFQPSEKADGYWICTRCNEFFER